MIPKSYFPLHEITNLIYINLKESFLEKTDCQSHCTHLQAN